MKFVGRVNDIAFDLKKQHTDIVLSSDDDNVLERFEKIAGADAYDIKIEKHSEKRSLDANAYMWTLLQQISLELNKDLIGSNAQRITKDDVYLDMLDRYGVFTHVVVKPEAVDRVMMQWRWSRNLGKVTIKGKPGTQLQCFYGSSTYSKDEFEKLLNGVISECHELGIETLDSANLKSLIEEWGGNIVN